MGLYHTPVLLRESIESLNIKSSGIYLDATFEAVVIPVPFWKQLGQKGRLLAFDQDPIQNKTYRR